MSAVNECIPLYDPGAAITAQAEAAVVGKRCVSISDPMQGPPQAGLSSTSEGSNIVCSHATAATRPLGVASHDAAANEKFYVLRGSGLVLPINAGAAIAAGAEVEVGTNGRVITKASGIAIGVAIDDCAATGTDLDAFVSLY